MSTPTARVVAVVVSVLGDHAFRSGLFAFLVPLFLSAQRSFLRPAFGSGSLGCDVLASSVQRLAPLSALVVPAATEQLTMQSASSASHAGQILDPTSLDPATGLYTRGSLNSNLEKRLPAPGGKTLRSASPQFTSTGSTRSAIAMVSRQRMGR